LWYKNPIESFGSINSIGNAKQQQLIVTAEPLRVASKTSAPMNEWSNIGGTFDVRDTGPLLNFDRRIPITESQLGLHNVSSYTWKPGYGYKRVFAEKTPTLNWADATRTPQITAENAASITPKQWTAAQDAAIARGDMEEAQRLRDLHFKVGAPNTQIKDIQYHGAKGNAIFNVFDPKLIGQTDQGWAGRGYYFTPSKDYAKMYGSKPRAFYINAQKVHDGTASTYFGREDGPAAQAFKIIRKKHGNDGQQILDDLASSDAIRTSFSQTQPYNGTFEEVVTRNNNQMKLADAVTYDDNGIRIPLGERDNFKLNDIRYGLLPFLGLGTTGSLYGTFNRRR
jgi:hypothetical protein